MIKDEPAMWDTWVQSLGWEDRWRRQRLPTPVFWPGEFHGLYSPWGRKELDTTERLSLHCTSEEGRVGGRKGFVFCIFYGRNQACLKGKNG